MVDTAEGPEWAIGCSVTLKTTNNEELSGTVFGYDSNTETVMLKEAGTHGGVCNLRLIKVTAIEKVLSAAAPKAPPVLTLPHVDKERARQREDKALRLAEEAVARVGVGVTKEAQSIFDALSKTMPCTWVEKTIVVMEVVHVAPPYSIESCVSKSVGHGGALERVKKVLQAERQRLGLGRD